MPRSAETVVNARIVSAKYSAGRYFGPEAVGRYASALVVVELTAMDLDANTITVGDIMAQQLITARESEGLLERAQRIGEETGDPALAAWALWVFGIARLFVGENGLSEMEQALATIRRLPQAAHTQIRSSEPGDEARRSALPCAILL